MFIIAITSTNTNTKISIPTNKDINIRFKAEIYPCVFAVLQLSEFVDHLTGLVSNTSNSSWNSLNTLIIISSISDL